ncbi:complement C1q-like protein 4 isoform X2 [Alosa sapidissima]|uniref:complement C1q-like protein 4 isoform X2 n=1 Tax=Alosa sapidissima TaxID=34773 RepID=UPI001C084D41|nr:complement C1q-like protein 4 isoform X2 [Alosa sapidissima]
MTTTKAVLLLLLWTGLASAESGGSHEDSAGAAIAPLPPRHPNSLPEMQEMLIEMRELELKLEAVEDNNADLNNTLKQLQNINEESKVAFSVSFSVSSDIHIGPHDTDITLGFNHVFSNIGNAYSVRSGIFTAPVRGVYQFQYHIFAGGSHGAGAKLMKNGEQVAAAYNHKAPHDINTSQGLSLLLEKGDEVSLLLEAGWWVAAYQGHLTTFSGQLLFLM